MEPEERIANLPKPRNDDRATVLIACLGILVALVLMGVTFTTLQRLESRGARNFLESVEANQISDAVIQYTIDRLRTGYTYTGPLGDPWRLGAAHMAYSPDPLNTTFSEFYNFSFQLPTGDAGTNSTCDVRVLDCSGQIYVGSGDGAMSTTALQAALVALMAQINATLYNASDAGTIVNATYGDGIHNKLQLQFQFAGTTTDKQLKYEQIRDYLTVYGVPDSSTVDSDLTVNPRVPINVNTASREVLIAVLTPLMAVPAGAPDLADEILANRPFRGWKTPPGASWTGFVDFLYDTSLFTATMSTHYGSAAWQADREVLAANFVPNSLLSLSNLSSYLRITPGKIAAGTNQTTEFCLQSSGYYEILLSTGIYGGPPDNALFARRKHEAIVKTHELWRQTTQRDFYDGSTIPADLATYPENMDALGAVAANASIRDGYIGFRPVDLDAAGSSGMTFYASFEQDFDAVQGTTKGCIEGRGMSDEVQITDPSTLGELARDGAITWTHDDSGTLYPQCLYYSADNFNAATGSLSFWLKPLFTPAAGISREIFDFPFGGNSSLTMTVVGQNLNATYTMANATNSSFLVTPDAPINWTEGEWHHIGLVYETAGNGTNASLNMTVFADNGAPAMVSGPVLTGGSLTLGTVRFGEDDSVVADKPTGTFDEITYFDSVNYADLLRDRYPAANATFTSASYPYGNVVLPFNTIIGPITWTELMPEDGTAAQIQSNQTADIEVRLAIDDGLGTRDTVVYSEMEDGGGGYFTNGNDLYEIQFGAGATGGKIRYEIQFRRAQTAEKYPSGKYGSLPYRIDTPMIDDITITLLPPAKVLYLREMYDE